MLEFLYSCEIEIINQLCFRCRGLTLDQISYLVMQLDVAIDELTLNCD